MIHWILVFALASVVVLPVNAAQVDPTIVPPDGGQATGTEQEDLAKKLVRQATGQGEEDIMTRIMSLMDQAHTRLAESSDPGDSTQAIQQTIVKELDFAIEQALAQRRPQKNSSAGQVSDKRTLPQQQQADEAQPASNEGAHSGTDPGPTHAVQDGQERGSLLGDLAESRRTWGNLPQRERDEIIQGAEQEVLDRYRPMIERYYRSLAESEDQE